MPSIRKLAEQDVAQLKQKKTGVRKQIESEYDLFLGEYEVGDYGEAELLDDESRNTVRQRFTRAAKRRGMGITFGRIKDGVMRFQITDKPADDDADDETR